MHITDMISVVIQNLCERWD